MANSLGVLIRLLLDMVSTIITKLFPAKSGLIHLPPITDSILMDNGLQLTEKIKSGKVKVVDVVNAFKSRIKDCEPKVNSVVEERFDKALQEAKQMDEMIAKELESGERQLLNLPLLGIPFAAKNCLQVEGMQLTAGFIARKGCVQKEDSPCIANLRKAGAIPIVLTNVPELAVWYDSANMLHGRTNNPYDLTRIPGGSSGGVAACVAYGGSLFGTGTDIAGSIRFPSHFCGLFGHLLTPKAADTNGHWPPFSPEQSEFLSIGPISRYASDLIPLVKGMIGDKVSLLPKLDQDVKISGLKFYYMEDDGGSLNTPVHPEIKQGIQRLARYLSDECNAMVQKISLPHMDKSFDIFMNTMSSRPSIPHTQKIANFKGSKNPWIELVKKAVNSSDHTLPVILVSILESSIANPHSPEGVEMIRWGEEIKAKLLQILGDDGVFIYPAFPEPAINHYTTIFKLKNTGYASIFSLMGHPITTCPIGFTSEERLPFGVQVIAAPFNDHLTLAVARKIEEKFGGWKPPSTVELSVK